MSEMGLKAMIRQCKYRPFKGGVGKVVPNILQRNFKAEKPNEKWVTDVIEFNVAGEKLYFSAIMDLFNGEIVSYRIQNRPTFDLVGKMLKKAFQKLDRPKDRYCIRIKVGSTGCGFIKSSWQERAYFRVSPAKEIVWTMQQWGVSSER